MNVKYKKKFSRLVKIALSDDDRISARITVEDLARLADGDLSHIGCALIDDLEVISRDPRVDCSLFDHNGGVYEIKPKKITVFGVEVEPFTDEELEQVNRHGLHVYAIAFNTESGGFGSIPNYCSISSLCNKTVFKSYAEGKAVADAMNRLGGFCEE